MTLGSMLTDGSVLMMASTSSSWSLSATRAVAGSIIVVRRKENNDVKDATENTTREEQTVAARSWRWNAGMQECSVHVGEARKVMRSNDDMLPRPSSEGRGGEEGAVAQSHLPIGDGSKRAGDDEARQTRVSCKKAP
jgi:hypothetical protein